MAYKFAGGNKNIKKTEIVEYKLSFEEIMEKFNIKGKYMDWNVITLLKEDDSVFKKIWNWTNRVNGISIKVKNIYQS
ncbi:MAG: hypothetical protein AABY22_31075 [Nanoarchaeota archaeon]